MDITSPYDLDRLPCLLTLAKLGNSGLMTITTQRHAQLAGVPVLLLAGFCAIALGRVAPLVSPLLIALILGAIAANVPMRRGGIPSAHSSATKILLRVGVVLIGLRLPLQDIVSIGLPGIVVIVVTVVLTFAATCIVGDRLGIERGLVTLIAAGFSICGASAIAAVEGGSAAATRTWPSR